MIADQRIEFGYNARAITEKVAPSSGFLKLINMVDFLRECIALLTMYGTVRFSSNSVIMSWFLFSRPNKELRCDFTINAYALTGRNTWYLQPGENTNGPGTNLKEEFQITCPWVSSHFTEYTAREAHKALLSNIKIALEQHVIWSRASRWLHHHKLKRDQAEWVGNR